MGIFLAIVDLLKTTITAAAWPLAVAAIALCYKEDIGKHLSRVRKAGPAGLELDAAVQQRAEPAKVSDPGELKELPGFLRTKAIQAVEMDLHKALKLVDTEHKIDILMQQPAVSRLSTGF